MIHEHGGHPMLSTQTAKKGLAKALTISVYGFNDWDTNLTT
jgi:hypothetical protein